MLHTEQVLHENINAGAGKVRDQGRKWMQNRCNPIHRLGRVCFHLPTSNQCLSFVYLKKYLFSVYVCVPEHMYVHQMLMCVKEPSEVTRGMNPLGLEIEGLGAFVWVLGTEATCYIRAASALNYWIISPTKERNFLRPRD